MAKIDISPAGDQHYDQILKIYNEAFLAKFRFINKLESKQKSFAHDMGLINLDIQGRYFVALLDSKVVGMLSLRFVSRKKEKSFKLNSSKKALFRKYGFFGIIRALIFDDLMTYHPSKGELYVESIGVGQDARGKGVGTLLLDFAQSYCEKLGLKKMSLHVMKENPQAKSLYERCGFVEKSYRKLHLLKKSTGYSGIYFMVRDI